MDLAVLTVDNAALGVRVEPPAATAASHELFGRQEDEFSTCGYWSFSNREYPWAPYRCRESECTTTGEFHGCQRGFVTTCYDSDDDKCTAGASGLPSLEKCCTNSGGTNCLTILKSDDGDWYTGFDCGGGRSGTQWVSVSPVEATATITEGDETSTVVQSTDLTTAAENDAERSSEPEGSDGDDDDDSNSTGSGSGSGSGGSETPVGAIVGGTIGGVALIALVGFAFWFLRIYKRKQDMKEKNVESNTGNPGQYNHIQPPGHNYTPEKTPEPGSEYYNGSTLATGGGGGGYMMPEMDGSRQPSGPAELNAVPTVELQGDFDRSR